VTRDERAKIVRALAEAEDGTTGRIGVRIVPDSSVDAFERAGREFKRAGLHRHQTRVDLQLSAIGRCTNASATRFGRT
jgi:hypothetical protein